MGVEWREGAKDRGYVRGEVCAKGGVCGRGEVCVKGVCEGKWGAVHVLA